MRDSDEESSDLYPGLCVCDGRVSGSITAGKTRLPLWAFIGMALEQGWSEVIAEDSWPALETEASWTLRKMSDFLYHLVQPRGEFARLLLLLANAEAQSEAMNGGSSAWQEQADLREPIKQQLQRCLDVLEQQEA